MTEPTDAELDTVLCSQWPAFSMQATLVRMWVRAAMRDAIAKWGTPPAGAGEPVAWRYRMKGDLQWQYTERQEQFAHADEVQPLATPQPTQAQAGAVPLTDEQKHARNPYRHSRGAASVWMAGFEAAELWYRIGIKGGQHG